MRSTVHRFLQYALALTAAAGVKGQLLLRGNRITTSTVTIPIKRELQPQAVPLPWTKEFVERLHFAASLGWTAKEDGISSEATSIKYNEQYQRFAAFDDGINDVSLVVKEGDVCYAIFRSQKRQNPLDVLQTLNGQVLQKAFGTNCDVRKSFYNGYENSYGDAFRAEIDTCVQSCQDQRCPLILSGNSAGSAIALVATLDPRLQQYNPLTLTLAPIRAIINEDCTDLNTNAIYRIVSCNAGYYDAVSDASPKIGYHVGHTYLVDELSHFSYIGYNNGKLRFPDNYNLHPLEVYVYRIANLLEADQFPVDVSLFANGHWCTEDDECESGTCGPQQFCISNTATTPILLLPGSPCTSDALCQSGKCHLQRCTLLNGLVGEGSSCNQHEECESQRCTAAFCLPKSFTGNWCVENAECTSNLCGGSFTWVATRNCLLQKCTDPDPETSTLATFSAGQGEP